jgi:PTS system galactitol-specific IIA component
MSIVFRELVIHDLDAADNLDVILRLGGLLQKGGFVKDSYIKAVEEREKIYPTGLDVSGVGIAIPHTDGSHVNNSAICVCKLKNFVAFHQMDEPETEIQAALVFMLAVNDPGAHLESLQKVMKILDNQEYLREFVDAEDEAALFATADKYLN